MSTERRIAFLLNLSHLVAELKDRGIQVAIFWYHRTPEQQRKLFKQGRVNPGKIVTNCDGYNIKSNHQCWEAADLCIIDPLTGQWRWGRNESYEILGELAKKNGLRWGGDWDGDEKRDPNDFDIYHVELQ